MFSSLSLVKHNSWVQSSNCTYPPSQWEPAGEENWANPLDRGLLSSQEEDWEMKRFCQTVIVQNFVKQLQSMFKVWFLHRNWMKSILVTNIVHLFLPSHVTGPRGCKFLLVLCHWWSSQDSSHRWGLHSGESSSPLCGTWNEIKNILFYLIK